MLRRASVESTEMTTSSASTESSTTRTSTGSAPVLLVGAQALTHSATVIQTVSHDFDKDAYPFSK
jgi:hypothetical protein